MAEYATHKMLRKYTQSSKVPGGGGMSAFHVLTGTDFGRANAWARRQPLNPINAAIRKQFMTMTTEMKVITRARFVSGPISYSTTAMDRDADPVNRPGSVIHPAELEYNGIRLFSEVPNSAAKAQKINDALSA